jgi:hypothetical protein
MRSKVKEERMSANTAIIIKADGLTGLMGWAYPQ